MYTIAIVVHDITESDGRISAILASNASTLATCVACNCIVNDGGRIAIVAEDTTALKWSRVPGDGIAGDSRRCPFGRDAAT